MSQLELFSKEPTKKLEYWTPFPGLVGVYYQSEDDKTAQRKSIDEWRKEKPQEAARLDSIIEELRAKCNKLYNKDKT